MPDSKTYFEQVPVDVVKKIAGQEDRTNGTPGKDNEVAKRPRKREPRKSANSASQIKWEEDEPMYPKWQDPLRAAIVELDKNKLKERVAAAEAAIFVRQQVLAQSSAQCAERQAIEDALATLRVIKRESLGFPDWERK